MSEADVQRLRQQLADCTRIMVMQEIMDFSGHISARIPGTDRALIQPRDTSRAGLTADDILVVDLDDNVLEGQGPAPSETALHTAVYKARPDAVAVCHGHPTMSTLFTVVDRPFLAVRNFAYRFAAGVPVHPDTTHIRTEEQGRAVAATLGQNTVCLLRGHGTCVASRSVEELLMDCLDIEENARSLLYASSLGPLLPITQDEVAQLKDSYGRSDYRAAKIWEHYQHKGRLAGIL
jgi:L-ribulose-5-phosphate 4-epimerase